MMDGAVVLQPAPPEQYYFPYFFDAYRRGYL
jgi:hypothetical protein